MSRTRVYLERGAKRVFACAYDWPGLCRVGRDEAASLQALATALPRYATVAVRAGLAVPTEQFDIDERLSGSGSTDFGVPGAIPASDSQPLAAADQQRLVALVGAAWSVFDDVVSSAPAELIKGPRGGGRDRDKIVSHVVEAELAYGTYIGVRGGTAPSRGDVAAMVEHRRRLLDALNSTAPTRWPRRYAARRIAWHVLDHAWEIQDKTPRST